MTNTNALRTRMAHALPFYYGWVVAGNGVALSLSTRTVMAVATLSVFVVPMTQSMGWSVGMFSGAVSLGGLAAVFVSPIVGRWLDKYGAGVILGAGSFATGAIAIGLAFVAHPLAFYALYVPGRMIFSGPLEMGLPTAISNWFIRRRPVGLAVDHIAKGAGLAMVPWAMTLIITGYDWRTAWIVLGILTFALGVVPSLLLVARRPEDMGLEPDPEPTREDSHDGSSGNDDAEAGRGAGNSGSFAEIDFTVGQALRTRAFWILAIFSGASMMVQAGLSLHQVSHYISQGIDPRFAAISASTFALAQMPAGLFWAALARRVPIRFLMMFASFVVTLAAARDGAERLAAAGDHIGGGHRVRRGRPAPADPAGVGGLLRAAEPGDDSRADDVGAGGGPGAGAGDRRVHVRLFRQLPDSVHVFCGGGVPGGDYGGGGEAAAGAGAVAGQ